MSWRSPLMITNDRRTPSNTKPARSATARDGALSTDAMIPSRSMGRFSKTQPLNRRTARVIAPRPRVGLGPHDHGVEPLAPPPSPRPVDEPLLGMSVAVRRRDARPPRDLWV